MSSTIDYLKQWTNLLKKHKQKNTKNLDRKSKINRIFPPKLFANTNDIIGWNVSNVTDFSSMFKGTTYFNQPINNWNVSGMWYPNLIKREYRKVKIKNIFKIHE